MRNPASFLNGEKLLLKCLAVATGGSDADSLRIDSSEDWETIIEPANRHGLGPLLYGRFKNLEAAASVPPGVIRRFESAYRATLKKNIKLFHEFAMLAPAFQERGIPVMALKGAQLAESVYGNPGLRPMVDLDLLVGKSDLAKAEQLLKTSGFRPGRHIGRIDRNVECGLSRELPQYFKAGGAFVDVHWTIEDPASPFAIDVDGLWARARSFDVGGVKTQGLSPEDLILHVCLHAAYHDKFRTGLMPFCDIAEIVRKWGAHTDWPALKRRALEWNAGKWVYIMLLMAKDLLKADVPDEVLDELKPADFDSEIAAAARAKIMDRDENISALSPNLALLWGGKPLLKKVPAYLRRLFPGRRNMTLMYPQADRGAKLYYYYFIRLRDLFRRYGLNNVITMYAHGSWRMLNNKEERKILIRRENALIEWLDSV